MRVCVHLSCRLASACSTLVLGTPSRYCAHQQRSEVQFISLPTTLCICTASRPVVSMCLLLSELYQYTHPGAPPIH